MIFSIETSPLDVVMLPFSVTSKERISYAKIASSAKSEDQLNAYGERLKSRGIEQNKINNILNTVRGMQD